MKVFDFIVVGGGPAGISLAKMLGKKSSIAIIRPEDYSMIYCALPYAVEGLIGNEKTFKSDSLVIDAGAELIRDTVVDVNTDEKFVVLESDEKLEYKKLIIASGVTPFIPLIPGSNLKSITGFKTEKDLLGIQEHLENGINKAVVIGAGAIGIEIAQAFVFKGLSVDLIDMADSVLPNLLDKDMSANLEYELANKGIRFHKNSKVISLKGKEYVEEVLMDNGKSISFSENDDKTYSGIVVFAVGMKSELDFIKNTNVETGKDGIIINNKMETNIPDVYAAGDCAQFYSGIDGNILSGKLATNAVPMAKILGANLLGADKSYSGFYNGAATKIGRYFMGGTGFSERIATEKGYNVICGYSEVTTKFPIMPDAKNKKMKLVIDKDTHRVLGAQIVSGEPVIGRIDLITFAIQMKAKVEDLANLSYASQPHQSFYPAANLIVLSAEDVLKKIDK